MRKPSPWSHPKHHKTPRHLLSLSPQAIFILVWSLPCSSQETSLWEWQAFSYSLGTCVISSVSISKPNFRYTPSHFCKSYHNNMVIRVGCMRLRWSLRWNEIMEWQSNGWGGWNMVLEENQGEGVIRIPYSILKTTRRRTGDVLERIPVVKSWSWEIRQSDLWVRRWLPQWREWQHQRTWV